jgi:Holliday junction resolvasome RuvABC ATP-dependent DNA helicase subunit
MLQLEDVFKTSGIPTYTFVPPVEFTRLKVYLRDNTRGLIVEGPSGIGKTTSIIKALEAINISGDVLSLSARKPDDVELITQIPSLSDFGTIIIDDFHKLDDTIKANLADFMKTVADLGNHKIKLILSSGPKVTRQYLRA